ncbi:MAG: hypothetical protein RLZZ227_624 [Pseudomonadota bacterium]|jgi:hypothetical protein
MQGFEETLLHSDFSGDPAALDAWFAADFTEVSPGGGVSSREQVMTWLLHKDPLARWQLSDLSAGELAPGLRLVRYHAKQIAPQVSTSKGALHCSFWQFNASLQRWQLRFHQATKII